MLIFFLFQKLCFCLKPRFCNRTRCGFVVWIETIETERFTGRGTTRDNMTQSFFFNTYDTRTRTIRTPNHFIATMFHKIKYHHFVISFEQFPFQQGSHKRRRYSLATRVTKTSQLGTCTALTNGYFEISIPTIDTWGEDVRTLVFEYYTLCLKNTTYTKSFLLS